WGPGHSIEIHGERGALMYRFFAEQILGGLEGADLVPIAIPPDEEGVQDTDEQFIQAIGSGGAVTPRFEDGLRYTEFCEAVALSVLTGAAVEVPPPASMDAWGSPLSGSNHAAVP
ncbi:MAG: hypothetical protein ACRD2X_21950, partial [Vicinamibacteraceae bacterium]